MRTLKEISEQLTNARLNATWTREYLALKSGVNVNTLKYFERTGKISLERLLKICTTLDVQVDFKFNSNIKSDRKRGLRNIRKLNSL